MVRKKWVLIAASVTALVVAAMPAISVGANAPKPAKGTPLVLGFLNSENDPAANYPEARVAAAAAQQYINTKLGGVGGHPIKIKFCTVKSTPEASQACANQMVQDKVAAVFNPYNFAEAVEYPIFEKAGIPTFGGGTGGAGLTSPVNTTWVSNPYQLNAAVGDYTALTLKAKKVSIIAYDLSVVLPIINPLKAGLANRGVDATFTLTSPATADWTVPVTSALQGNPDALIVYTSQAGCIGAMKAYQQLGGKVPVVTSSLCADGPVLAAVGSAAYNWSYVQPWAWPTDTSNKEVATFNQALLDYAAIHRKFTPNAGGASELAFSLVMTLYQKILVPLGYDKAKPAAILAKARSITSGNSYMGTLLYKCGKFSKLPSACGGNGGRVYKNVNGKFVPADGGKFIGTDLALYGANG